MVVESRGGAAADGAAAPAPAVVHSTRSLNRGAIALVANGAATAALGVGYWLLAAHLYPTSIVGRNSALVSAMLTISGLSQCNFTRSLSGLLPRAREHAVRLLGNVYALTVGISLVIGLGFAAVVPYVDSQMHFVRGEGLFLPGFALAVGIWTVFTLEDTALASVRSAHIIPFENATFGVLKIGLLVLLHHFDAGSFSIFISWIAPLIVIVLPINWYLFTVALPGGAKFAAPPPRTAAASRRWVAYDLAGYVLYLLGTLPLPFLVLTRLGSVKSAAFYIPFTIVLSIDLLSLNVGNPFTAELQRRDSHLDSSAFAFMVKIWVLVAAAAAVLAAGAPLVLQLFGSHYRTGGQEILVVLVAASLPRSVMFFTIAAARAHGHGQRILLLQGVAAVGTLVVGLSLMGVVGAVGMAWGWLAASLASGLIAASGLARAFRRRAVVAS